MKTILTLLHVILIAPLAAFAQNENTNLAKPEVALATKAAKRAWESAPAEKKAHWQKQRDALTNIDLSEDTQRQIIIARGSSKAGEYHAHPTTAMLADNKTIFCVWNIGHGGHAGPMARSDDAGLTWKRIDDVLPPNYVNFKNCPSIYRITDPQGKERLWVFAARTLTDKENPKPIAGRHEGYMPRILSEDDGKTWRELPPIGGRIAKDDPFRCIMTFSSIVRLKDGSSLGLFHRGSGIGEEGTLQVLQSITRDGGFTWSEPTIACDGTKLDGKHPCEPYVFRSPAGDELCCIMRENRRSGTSLVMFSRDEGQTWSQAVDTPWGLTGDRHHGITLPDGRMVIVFRNASPNPKDKGFIAWVGTYDEIKQGKPGQYRISLLKTFKDGFYPGLHLLPDGTIVATTYANYRQEDIGTSIVSVRFKMSEADALAALHADELRLPSIFSDHMVLQSGKAVPVWGWADPGEQVAVEFAGQSKSTTANADGKWTVKLDALEASADSRELVVRSLTQNRSLKVADVLVGEVWAGGGQSNMEFDMKAITSATVEIETSANPALRQFQVLKNPSADVPADDVQGFWTVARPGTTEDFIAAGYYFAKSIQRELKTPVGLIKVCWGGSKVEPWLSPGSLASVPELAAAAKNMDAMSERNKSAFREWLKRTQREDRPAGDVTPFTSGPVSKDDGWLAVKDSGPVSDPSLPKLGAIWFRKEVALTARQTGAAQVLQFGPSAQFEQVYWNGTLIGERSVDSFTGLTSVRHYLIPPALLKEGVNQLAVRLFAPAEPPGFSWFPSVGTTKILGGWMAKAEFAMPPLDAAGKKAVPPLTGQHVLHGRLFNGMVHPILPYAIRGVLWYQGESNTGNAGLYRTSLPLLIKDWRQHWQQGDFPFYFCQLANYRAKTDQPGESVWAELREAQSKTLSVPNTGMAVLIDTGESEDIHPQSKQVAGERLARIALAKTYDRDVVPSGPVYMSMKIEGSVIRLSFDHLGGGLVAEEVPATYDVMCKVGKTAPLVRNSPRSQLEGFAICGDDRNWVWAEAKIEGDTVLVSSDRVPQPIAVRYGWADNPTCNLYNQAGLPASPFRTDDFAFATTIPAPPAKPTAKPSAVSNPTLSNQPAPPPGKPLSTTPTPRTDNPGWMKIVERQAAAAKPGRWDLVLIGDSITAGWQSGAPSEIWAKHFSAYQTLNLGIAADKTENVLWRLGFSGTLDGYQPKLFILLIGTNNTGHRYGTETADDTAQGVRAILDTLATKAPGAKILLLAIFPRGEAIKRQRNDEVNRQIEKLADNKQVFWLNLSEHFIESDGTISRRLFKDEKPYPIHLTAEGYETWAKAMQPKVEQLTKE